MEINMKTIGYITAIVGFLLIIGTVGNSDYYDQCKAAADCVAGEPQSAVSVFLHLVAGVVLMAIGSFWAYIWSE
jgi:hypothetical protein